MYAGHLGLALVETGRRPDLPLWPLVAASLAPDLMVVPLWHTIPFAAALVALAYVGGSAAWDRGAGAVLALLVASHIGADLLTSELHVWPNSGTQVGLALYDVPAVDLLLEGAAIAAGWLVWRRAVRADADSSRTMLVLLLVSQVLFDVFVSAGANEA